MSAKLWFSSLRGLKVTGAEGDAAPVLGDVADAVIRLVEVGNPVLAGLVVGDERLFVPVARMGEVTDDGVAVAGGPSSLTEFERRPGEVLIGRDLLGHKLICFKSRLRPRLVRAEDAVLAKMGPGGIWELTGIDTGDRLGRQLRRRLLRRSRRSPDEPSEAVVAWRYLEPLVGHVPTARRRLALRNLRKLHPAQIADLLEAADEAEGEEIMEALESDPGLEADVFEELDSAHRLEAIRDRSDAEVASLLDEMEPDDAADLISALEQDRRLAVLERLQEPQHEIVKALLDYNPESAGGMMNPSISRLQPGQTVGSARSCLRQDPALAARAGGCFLVDSAGHYRGYVPLARLIAAEEHEFLVALADPDPPRVMANADLVEVALTMADYNLTALAVTAPSGELLGAITVDDVLGRLIPNEWRRRMEAL